jgi:hypothetical protein
MIINMNKFKNISYAVAAFLVTTATSCTKQLEEYNPGNATAQNLWSTPTGFAALTATAYQDLHLWYGVEDGEWLLEGGTDLWFIAKRGGYAKQLNAYDGLASGQGQSKNMWQYAYRGINLCNAGIARADKAGFKTEAEKNQRLGELHFMRAFYNFQLVEHFGGVILRTKETDETEEMVAYRSTPEQFYDLIISDLEFAKNNLPISWAAITEHGRATKKSAMGMYARVLLTKAYYTTGAERTTWFTKARDAAKEVIDNKGTLGIELYPNFKDAMLALHGKAANRYTNKEAMFVVPYNEDNQAANLYTTTNGNRIFKYALTKYSNKPGFNNTYVNAYGVDNQGILMPTWHLLDLFDETRDSRYAASFLEKMYATYPYKWLATDVASTKYDKNAVVVGKETKIGDLAMYCTKGDLPFNRKDTNVIAVGKTDIYVNPVHGQPSAIVNNTVITEYYPSFTKFVNPNRTTTAATDFSDAYVMRFAEMYLIAAEACVQLNQLTDAATYVNKVRDRAGITTADKAALQVGAADMNMDFILDERAREFVGEQQRWMDLKRVFRGQDWVNYIKKWNPDITLVQPYHWIRPIPRDELNTLLNATEFGQNPEYQ